MAAIQTVRELPEKAGIGSTNQNSTEAVPRPTLTPRKILDALPIHSYDRIIRRVSEFFSVPICMMSFVGKDDQWIKAKNGGDIDRVPCETFFNQTTLDQDDVFVVLDPLNDARFSSHPSVVGTPGIRFYAGISLIVEGNQKVGILCIADVKEHVFDATALSALKDFGALVSDELDLRLRAVRLEAQLLKKKETEASALASQQARAEFLAMVTHEIRAPLNAIAGLVALMCQTEQPEFDDLSVETLRDSTEQLVRMINEVLDLARLEATGVVVRY